MLNPWNVHCTYGVMPKRICQAEVTSNSEKWSLYLSSSKESDSWLVSSKFCYIYFKFRSNLSKVFLATVNFVLASEYLTNIVPRSYQGIVVDGFCSTIFCEEVLTCTISNIQYYHTVWCVWFSFIYIKYIYTVCVCVCVWMHQVKPGLHEQTIFVK